MFFSVKDEIPANRISNTPTPEEAQAAMFNNVFISFNLNPTSEQLYYQMSAINQYQSIIFFGRSPAGAGLKMHSLIFRILFRSL